MNIKIVIYFIFNIIIIIKSQQQQDSCIFNGIDYSNLYSKNGYNSSSAYNWANDNEGRYKFFWNICGLTSICTPSDGGVACQKIDSKYQIIGEIYNVKWNKDPTINNKTSITYYSEQTNCPNNRKRQFTINLICTDDDLYSTNVYEDEPCYYSVTMYGACGKPIQSDSSSSSQPNENNNKCIYNGIDYSSVSTINDYKSNSGNNYRNNTNYRYEYYWNICGSSKSCGPNVAACQKEINIDDNKETGRTQIIGQISKGVWSKDLINNAVIITYSTDNKVYCQNEKARQFKVYLICNNNNNEGDTITNEINEDDECIYSTKIYTCGTPIK